MKRFIPTGLAIASVLFLVIKGEWIGLGIFLAALGLTLAVLHRINK